MVFSIASSRVVSARGKLSLSLKEFRCGLVLIVVNRTLRLRPCMRSSELRHFENPWRLTALYRLPSFKDSLPNKTVEPNFARGLRPLGIPSSLRSSAAAHRYALKRDSRVENLAPSRSRARRRRSRCLLRARRLAGVGCKVRRRVQTPVDPVVREPRCRQGIN